MLLANSAQIRRADQLMIEQYNLPGLLLMETAGRKCAEFILQHFPDHERGFLVLAGPGNNGGDGFVIARYLRAAGKYVEVLLSHPPERLRGDALINFRALTGRRIPIAIFGESEPSMLSADTYVIDALLGTGLKKAPHGNISEIIDICRKLNRPCIAIDLPSGLNADTGLIADEFEPLVAEYTLTFQCPKLCHFTTPASNYCGKVVTIDIGILPAVMEQLNIRRRIIDGKLASELWMLPAKDTHKGKQGHSLFIGGSKQYAGAIALSAHAALHSGGGLSTALTVEAARTAVFEVGPEVMVNALPGDFLSGIHAEEVKGIVRQCAPDAVGIGPGLGQEAAQLMPGLLEELKELPLVLDADALNIVAKKPDLWRKIPPQTILTPHPGEFRRLYAPGLAEEDRVAAAESFVQKRRAILVLKGAHTIVAAAGKDTYINSTGNPGMATAGSGDVLTGTITALLARGYIPFDAAVLGVYLHGLAGDLCAEESGQAGVTAGGIMRKLGKAAEMVQTGTTPKLLSL